MKKLSILLLAVLSIGMLSGCGTRVDPGYVGVKVNTMGKDRGVSDIPVSTGFVFYNPLTETVFEYPTFTQTAVWTRDATEGSPANEEISFNTKQGMTITTDISLAYQLEAAKVPAFYVKFRNDDLRGFTHGYLRNVARDAFNEVGSHYTAEEIYSSKKEVFREEVLNKINKQVEPFGVKLNQFGFIGAFRSPITDSMSANARASADTQTALNKIALSEAEGDSMIALAKKQAEANRIISASLTPQLLEQMKVEKWDGHLPQSTGGNTWMSIGGK